MFFLWILHRTYKTELIGRVKVNTARAVLLPCVPIRSLLTQCPRIDPLVRLQPKALTSEVVVVREFQESIRRSP